MMMVSSGKQRKKLIQRLQKYTGDYIFGWRGDTLAKAFEKDGCGDQICGLTTQEIEFANNCQIQPRVKEEVDGWLDALPGMEMEVDGGSFHSTQ